MRRAAALPPSPEGLGPQLREQLPSVRVWDANRNLAERTVRAVCDCSGLVTLAAHPFALINARTVCGERPYATVEAMIDSAEAILQRLDRWLEGGSSVVSGATPLAAANETCVLAERLVGTGLGHSLDLLDPTSARSAQLQAELAGIAGLDNAYAKAARRAANWMEPLTPGDTDAALELARSKEKSFFRFLSGQWRALKKTVRARYEFSSHTVVPSITSVLEMLAARHEAAAAVEAGREALQTRLQTADLDGLLSLRDELLTGQRHSALTAKMLQTALTSGLPNETLMQEVQQAREIGQLLSVVGEVLDGVGGYTFDQLAELLRDLREALGDLPDMLPALGEIHRADKGFALIMRSIPLPLPALEELIVDEAIARIERADPEINRFDIDRLIAVSRRAAAARENLRAENADAIRATLHRNSATM